MPRFFDDNHFYCLTHPNLFILFHENKRSFFLEILNRFPVIFAPFNISYMIWIVVYMLLGYWLVMNLKRHLLNRLFSLVAYVSCRR